MRLYFFNHKEPSAAAPQPKLGISRERRKGRKEIKLPDLAFLASWREQIPLFWIATGHRKICARRKNSKHSNAKVTYFVFYAFFAEDILFPGDSFT